MKIKNILTEVPLPDDWDTSRFKPEVSFAEQLRYATARAQKVGTGSSRVAFAIDYDGRKTVLKIAKNKKGVAQNDYESQMLGDRYVEALNITIPIIDYDEQNDPPRWIHTEFADKMKPTQFKKFFGVHYSNITRIVGHLSGRYPVSMDPEQEERYQQLYEDNDYIDSLVDLAGNYDIGIGDFSNLSNWGIYKGEPVIIDIGLSSEIYDLHYKR
jgi:hypothetical protein